MLNRYHSTKLYLRIRSLARQMRKRPTEAEDYFWEKVRNRKLFGLKWNRQYIIPCRLNPEFVKYYIADFHCHEHKLIVELDGHIHIRQQEEDLVRTERMIDHGFMVLRYSNEQVIHEWGNVEHSLKEFVNG